MISAQAQIAAARRKAKKQQLTPAQQQIRDAENQAKREVAEEVKREFKARCVKAGLPEPEDEFRFHPDRMWSMDYAWPDHQIYIEVEGGIWTDGRHTRSEGFIKDIEKYNGASELLWYLFRCQPNTLMQIIPTIKRTMTSLDIQRKRNG